MSVYAMLEGEITYPNKEHYQKHVTQLQMRGVLDAEGYFLNERNERISGNPNLWPESNTIELPNYIYRNLEGYDFFDEPTVKGHLVGTTTDGTFEGWFIEDGIESNYFLTEWAKDNMEGDNANPPENNNEDDDTEYVENYAIWAADVQQEFFDSFLR